MTEVINGQETTASSSSNTPSDAEYVTTKSDAGLSGEAVIPSLANSPDILPANPNTEDDEFDSNSLDAKWTLASTAASYDIDTTWPSCIYANFTGDQYISIQQDYAPAGAFTITVCVEYPMLTNFQGANIYVYDDDESEAVACSFYSNTGIKGELHTRDATVWTYARSSITLTPADRFYLRIQRGSSNDWSCWVSFNGKSFWRIGTYSKTMTVDHFQVKLNQGGVSTPCRAGIDWVRRDWQNF